MYFLLVQLTNGNFSKIERHLFLTVYPLDMPYGKRQEQEQQNEVIEARQHCEIHHLQNRHGQTDNTNFMKVFKKCGSSTVYFGHFAKSLIIRFVDTSAALVGDEWSPRPLGFDIGLENGVSFRPSPRMW